MAVPYTFSTATGSLPLSQLDSNFSTAITIGNTAVVLGDSITTINNLTLANVAITSVSTAFPNGYLANSNVIVGTTTLTLGSTVTSINGLSLSNVTISSGNVTISNVTTTNVTATTANVTTANVGTLVVIGDATVGGNTTVTGNITAAKGTFTSANVSGTANVSTLAVVINATIGGNATVTGNVSAANGTFTSANISGTSNISTLVVTGTSTMTGVVSIYNATSAVIQVDGDATSLIRATRYSTDTNGPSFQARKSRGTYASPTAVASGDTVGNFQGLGYGGTNYRIVGSISAVVDTFTSDTNISGYLAFNTNSGSTTATERMRIDSSGNVLVGTTGNPASAKFFVAGTSVFGTAAAPEGQLTSDGTNAYLDARLTGGGLIFRTNGSSERMRIDSAGRLLLGASTAPASGAVRQVITGGTSNYLEFASTSTDGALIGNIGGAMQFFTFTGVLGSETYSERMRIDAVGNAQFSTGAVMPYAPAPAAVSAATTLTNANIQGQIISATGTTYTITMPLGTTMETLASWATTNIAYDFFVINTATGVITMAVNTGVTSLGSLTVAIGASAHFRIRRTAANTFVLYRLV